MKRVLVLLISIVLFNCQLTESPERKITDLIPDDADIILAIYDLETTRTDLRTNDLINGILNLPDQEKIISVINQVRSRDTLYLCLGLKSEPFDLTLITRPVDSLFGDQTAEAMELQIKQVDSFIIASSRDYQLQTENKGQSDIEDLMKGSSGDKPFSILMRHGSSNILNQFLTYESSSEFSGSSLVEMRTNSERILLNGITYPADSIHQLLGVFRNNRPQEHSIKWVAPNNADGYISFTYNDFESLSSELQAFRQRDLDSLFNPELFQTLSEVGEIFFGDESLVAMKSIDPSATTEALRDQLEQLGSFRNVNIYKFDEGELFYQVFEPLIRTKMLNTYIRLDDYFVFAESQEAIQNVIVNFQNGTTIGKSSAYESCSENLSDAASLSVVAKSDKLQSMLGGILGAEAGQLPTEPYNLSAFQWIGDIGFTHFNGVIQKHQKRAVANAINEEFSLDLEADIIMPPQFVTNHRNKQRDIVVQDVNNTLYFISNTGQILWKRKLIGNILGKVEQVDLYRNGRLQLAFATPFRVYVIDRNGKNVGAFPMKFGDRITQPLSVFDYDNNRQYRFLVTQGKDLLMYDRNARFVSGFRYENPNNIITQPKHFRISNKDYIVFAAGNRMMILNRRGQLRINVKERFDFSGNPIFLYKNNFMTTTAMGEIIRIDQNGKVSKADAKLGENHRIDATAKTLVTLDENQLGIKEKSVELDYGEYTEPRIHYIYDKIYVTLTDRQSQKIYLFDSQAEPIPNFPVYGNSTIDLDNADADRNLEFVTQGESNTVVMYKKN